MDWKSLLKKCKEFQKEEIKACCYDMYKKNKGTCWLKSKTLPDAEIMKLFRFIRAWDPRFSGKNSKKFQKIYKEIYRYIKSLESKTIESIDLENKETKDKIRKVFNEVTKCGKRGKREWTDTSKILHCILPELFVMWDDKIRRGVWSDNKKKLRANDKEWRKNKKKWNQPKDNKFTGKEYAFHFLPQMQKEADEAIRSYQKDNNHCSRSKAIREMTNEAGDHTIAKLIDEYNYMIHTFRK